MPFQGEQPERWCVHLVVTRDPRTESTPGEWDWERLLGGGEPVVLSANLVGYETQEEPCPPASSPSESS